MDSLRPFQPIGTTFLSTGSSTADAIPSTPMGTSAIRIVNSSGDAAKVALGDTAAEAVANLTTQYITLLAGSVEYLQIKNTQRFIASDTAGLVLVMGTGGGAGYGVGGGSGGSGFLTQPDLDSYFVNVLPLGADDTGVADSLASFEAARDLALLSGGSVYIPQGTYHLSDEFDSMGVPIRGAGIGVTILEAETAAPMHVIFATGVARAVVEDMTIIGPGAQGGTPLRGGVTFDTVESGLIRNVHVIDADTYSFNIIDSSDVLIEGCIAQNSDARYNNGAGTDTAYGFWIDCSQRCQVRNSYGYQLLQSFVLVGNDDSLGASTNDHNGTAALEDCWNNSVIGCVAYRCSQHHFNANTSPAAVFRDCIAIEYNGSATPRPAFQMKAPTSTDVPEGCSYIGCVAIDCDSGFMSQEGTYTQLHNFTAVNCAKYGVLFNSSPYSQAINISIIGFTTQAFEASQSPSVILDNLTSKAAAGGALVAVKITSSGSVSVGRMRMQGTHTNSLVIDASSNSVSISPDFRCGAAISDLATNTMYPLQYSVTVDVSGGSKSHGIGYPGRQAYVGRIDLCTVEDVVGTTPTIGVGEPGLPSKFISGQNPNATAGNITSFIGAAILNSRVLQNGKFLTALTNGAATSGRVMVSVHALYAV